MEIVDSSRNKYAVGPDFRISFTPFEGKLWNGDWECDCELSANVRHLPLQIRR